MMTFYPIQENNHKLHNFRASWSHTLGYERAHAWASSYLRDVELPQPYAAEQWNQLLPPAPPYHSLAYFHCRTSHVYLIVNDYSTSLTRQSACGRQGESYLCLDPKHMMGNWEAIFTWWSLVQCEQHPILSAPKPSVSPQLCAHGWSWFGNIYSIYK